MCLAEDIYFEENVIIVKGVTRFGLICLGY